jgi:hypothetical protein
MSPESIFSTLSSRLPGASVAYCFSLWNQHPFDLKLTKRRSSKVGDFSAPRGRLPLITLNNDLNPYLFLVTYVHEVAHLFVHKKSGNRVEPHGVEWKEEFRVLMLPLLKESSFPAEILHELRRHMADPKASSFADTALTNSFRKYDPEHLHSVQLSEVAEGSVFKLQGKYFKKGKLRRTRIVCREMKTRRLYLVPADSLVGDVQLSLL